MDFHSSQAHTYSTMAISKALLYLGFLFALVLLISSEVAATQTSIDDKNVDTNHAGVIDAKYPAHGNDYGNGGQGGGGRGRYDPPQGRRCYHGCCRRSRYGGDCLRCCSFAGEAVDAQAGTGKPGN